MSKFFLLFFFSPFELSSIRRSTIRRTKAFEGTNGGWGRGGTIWTIDILIEPQSLPSDLSIVDWRRCVARTYSYRESLAYQCFALVAHRNPRAYQCIAIYALGFEWFPLDITQFAPLIHLIFQNTRETKLEVLTVMKFLFAMDVLHTLETPLA